MNYLTSYYSLNTLHCTTATKPTPLDSQHFIREPRNINLFLIGKIPHLRRLGNKPYIGKCREREMRIMFWKPRERWMSSAQTKGFRPTVLFLCLRFYSLHFQLQQATSKDGKEILQPLLSHGWTGRQQQGSAPCLADPSEDTSSVFITQDRAGGSALQPPPDPERGFTASRGSDFTFQFCVWLIGCEEDD